MGLTDRAEKFLHDNLWNAFRACMVSVSFALIFLLPISFLEPSVIDALPLVVRVVIGFALLIMSVTAVIPAVLLLLIALLWATRGVRNSVGKVW